MRRYRDYTRSDSATESVYEKYRKIVALVVTGLVVYTLQMYGMSPSDLRLYELSLPAVVGPVVDFIIMFGIPAAFAAAAPMGTYFGSQWLIQHWKYWVGGIVIVALLVVAVTLIGGLWTVTV